MTNINTLKENYNTAVNSVSIFKSEYQHYKTAAADAKYAVKSYKEQLVKQLEKEGLSKMEIFKKLLNDTEYKRLLRVADSFNIEQAETALNCAYDNLGRAIHNIMLYEAQQNLEKLSKYKIGYKRFSACFKIGTMSTGGLYCYGIIDLPYDIEREYLDFDRYEFDGKIKTEEILNYVPYDILTAEKIKEEVKAAFFARKVFAEKLEKLRKELENENEKRVFYRLKIGGSTKLNINYMDR